MAKGRRSAPDGRWTREEDAILKDFVEKNRGTGGFSWIMLPGKAGLQRHGKSCRSRWVNHLQPGIKRGSFTEEEEKTIIDLHGMVGTRWSFIADKLPGRTDNDKKNYWNTRLKKEVAKKGIFLSLGNQLQLSLDWSSCSSDESFGGLFDDGCNEDPSDFKNMCMHEDPWLLSIEDVDHNRNFGGPFDNNCDENPSNFSNLCMDDNPSLPWIGDEYQNSYFGGLSDDGWDKDPSNFKNMCMDEDPWLLSIRDVGHNRHFGGHFDDNCGENPSNFSNMCMDDNPSLLSIGMRTKTATMEDGLTMDVTSILSASTTRIWMILGIGPSGVSKKLCPQICKANSLRPTLSAGFLTKCFPHLGNQ